MWLALDLPTCQVVPEQAVPYRQDVTAVVDVTGRQREIHQLAEVIDQQLNIQIDLGDKPGHSIGVRALHDLDAVRRNAALLTETQHVDAHALADRGEKRREQCRRLFLAATLSGLLGLHIKAAKAGIDLRSTGKSDLHFQCC